MIPESQGSLTARVSVMGFEHCRASTCRNMHAVVEFKYMWKMYAFNIKFRHRFDPLMLLLELPCLKTQFKFACVTKSRKPCIYALFAVNEGTSLYHIN